MCCLIFLEAYYHLADDRVSLPLLDRGLDVSSLENSLQFYFQQGLAPSTHRTYKSATLHSI